MKPLTKLERQYIAYWTMNIVASFVPGVSDEWAMDCPVNEDDERGRLYDVVHTIVKLSRHHNETAE